MYKILLTTAFFFLLISKIFGQKGYYADDSTKTIGVKIIDRGSILNAESCQVEKKDSTFTFSPYEINEYGISKDLIYVARSIQSSDTIKRVFLEVLYKGKTSLYFYQDKNYKTFFISKDSASLVEIPRKRDKEKHYYQSVLSEVTNDCPEVADAIELVTYRRKSLTELINRYNNCEDKPFPFFKFGVLGGYELSGLANTSQVNPSLLENFDYQFNGFFIIGVFADLPLIPTNYSIHTELYHSSHSFSESATKDDEIYDLTVNQNSLKMPILLRYTFNRGKINPFINAGGIIGFNYENENAIYITNKSTNTIEINKLENISVISPFQYGFSAGGGIERKINNKNALFLELRFNKLFGMSKNTLGNNELQLITGINF